MLVFFCAAKTFLLFSKKRGIKRTYVRNSELKYVQQQRSLSSLKLFLNCSRPLKLHDEQFHRVNACDRVSATLI